MSNCWKLTHTRVTDVVMVAHFEDDNRQRFIVRMTRVTGRLEVDRTWSVHDAHSRGPVYPKLWQAAILADKMHSAVAYTALTGGVDGFPEFDPLID